MKCYVCGQQTSKHAVGCPEYRKLKSKTNPIVEPTVSEFGDLGESFGEEFSILRNIGKGPMSWGSPRTVEKPITSFLPLSLVGSNTVIPAGETRIVQGEPMMDCKPKRLWIDEQVSPYFNIDGIYIGVRPQYVAPGSIPANLFRTGRWPLSSASDVITEFGIDLSTWDTILIGMRFSMHVSNYTLGTMPFRGCLEVLAIKP